MSSEISEGLRHQISSPHSLLTTCPSQMSLYTRRQASNFDCHSAECGKHVIRHVRMRQLLSSILRTLYTNIVNQTFPQLLQKWFSSFPRGWESIFEITFGWLSTVERAPFIAINRNYLSACLRSLKQNLVFGDVLARVKLAEFDITRGGGGPASYKEPPFLSPRKFLDREAGWLRETLPTPFQIL